MNENKLRLLIKEALGAAYKILGVSPRASHDEIKAAYRKLAIQLHPDRNKDTDTTPQMAKVNRAWNLLSDPTTRSAYDIRGDRTLDHEDTPPSPRPTSTTQQKPPTAQPSKQPNPNYTQSNNQLRFEFKQGTSRKFWTIELKLPATYSDGIYVVVTWGRIGTQGNSKTHKFNTMIRAQRFISQRIYEKTNKGYVQVSKNQSDQQTPKEQPKAQPKNPPESDQKSKTKTTYKIYGKSKSSWIHTKYKGVEYGPKGFKTKFKTGDKANVYLGPDGKLRVRDTTTDHTQTWEKNEAVRKFVNTLIVEHIADIVKNK